MDQAARFLFLIGLLLAVVFSARTLEAYAPKFLRWFRQTAHPLAKTLAGFVGVVFLAIFVISKDFLPNSIYNFTGTINESPYVELYSPESALLSTTVLTNSLTPAQYRAQVALTAVTNVTYDFTAPTNAVLCDLGPGVHDEAYWIPLTFNSEGTATNSRWGSAVCAVPSGFVLLDDLPDRIAPSIPELSGAVTNRVLSILQTPSGLLPPAGKLWHAATTNDSHLITWENVFLGRDTNAVANLQLELFQNGDFIYRIQLDEDGDYSSVTNWLIAAQNNGGGEVFAFADDAPVTQLETDPLLLLADSITANPVFTHLTNGVSLRPQALELRWTYFGELDPGDESGTAADSDNDGLSDWDELFVYHTDPGNPDTDSDGLWDGEEVNQYGTNPVNSDSNNDGDLDFWQVFSPSSFTNAPWAEESESTILLTITTYLANSSSPDDLAVLRVGDYFIPVSPGNLPPSRIAIPKGGEVPFILIPGPGSSASGTAQITALESNGLVVFEDSSDVFTIPEFNAMGTTALSLSTVPMSAISSSGTGATLRPTGKVFGIGYDVIPQVICPHTGHGVLRFVNVSNPRNIHFGFLINESAGLISETYTITDEMLGKIPENPSGFYTAFFGFYVRADPIYKQVSDFHTWPAHYCIPVQSVGGNYPECQTNNVAYDPYAVPMPKNSEGEYYGTYSRPHVKLIIDGDDDCVGVGLSGDTSYANRCAFCGCSYTPGSGHTPETVATIYRRTPGLEVSPQAQTSNGCFSVSGIKPSGDYGADVFTYQIGSWYNRGRYTVLGLKNHLAYNGGPVEEAHVAVGVTNALVLWTGVKLPTGTLNLSLMGDGHAEILVYNRVAQAWEDLLTPSCTNYTTTIANWRNTYCDPDTLHVQAYLVAEENGLCTLTQSFEGSGNGIPISHSVSQPIRIHTFVAEPITSETYGGGYVYNPSGIPVGGTAKFKVSLDPMTGLSEDDIVWDGAGVTFVNNDNTGPEITVQGGSVGLFLLAPSVTGLRLLPSPLLHGNVMTPTTAPVTVWIVRDDDGFDAPITTNAIPPIIADANRILRQKALTLSWGGTANYIDKTAWQNITDVQSPTNAALNALLNSTNSTGGLEFYFINSLNGGAVGGVNCSLGIALGKDPQGRYPEGRIISHEVLHQCGLLDIYVDGPTNETSLVVSGQPSNARLLGDWGGGYYPKDLMQAELIRRLVMNGEINIDIENSNRDLPSDGVYGLHYVMDPVGHTNIYSMGEARVGQTGISTQTPEHQ